MKISRFLRLGVILPQPGQLRPDSSNSYGLDALVSNVNTYAVNLDNLTQSGTNITLTGPQALIGVVRLVGAASNNFTVTLPPTARLIDALGPTIPKDGSFAVEISIQNEDPTYTATLTAGDASTTINGTTIIAAGTRRIWLLTVGSTYDYTVVSIQNIGTFSTSSTIAGSGTVTSVGIAVPTELTISGSPITSAGTMTIGKANETANTVWAGPTSGGAAQPTFRTLVLGDLPGGVGSGSVTSVAMTVPAEFSVSGSPITTSGTLAITKATESANTVWAGPTTGAPAQPAFRALTTADLPASLGLTQTFITLNAESSLSNSRHLVAGSNITLTDSGAGGTVTIASTAAGGGGTLQSQIFTSSGTFTVPASVSAVWLVMIGGGGAGAAPGAGTEAGGGGGAGELVEGFMVPVTALSSCTVVVGAGAVASGTLPAPSGAASSFNNGTFTFSAAGGAGAGGVGSPHTAGSGGGAGGGVQASAANGVLGTMESPAHIGGGSGGSGGNAGSPYRAGLTGAGAGGILSGGTGGTTNGATGNGGGGGGATLWGIGGAGGNAGSGGSSASATSYGAGGGGAGQGSSANGGSGANGRVEVYWIG